MGKLRKLKERDDMGYVTVCGRVKLKFISEEQILRAWTVFNCLRIMSSNRIL
jgi:hypothetical protein